MELYVAVSFNDILTFRWETVAFIITPQETFFDIPVKKVPTKDNVYVGVRFL